MSHDDDDTKIPRTPPKIDFSLNKNSSKYVPPDERNITDIPDCLGKFRYFDIGKSKRGELIGMCLQCPLWRQCLAKRIER